MLETQHTGAGLHGRRGAHRVSGQRLDGAEAHAFGKATIHHSDLDGVVLGRSGSMSADVVNV